ncbi:MAG: tannase/feruloyl esterase family alpha/beta hydrolase [Alphaproteobacteria bacterium]|nr:MAG: tannase/feruloyl esterase family alpha/beta hydrolase [Alphaproteobacteria bacterium]
MLCRIFTVAAVALTGFVFAGTTLRAEDAAVCQQVAADRGATATFADRFDGLSVPPGAPMPVLPVLCRIQGVDAPVPGSRIGYEVWLPADGWNGRLQVIGNGGYSSAISHYFMALYAARGYAVAATDTGHTGDDPVFGKDNPEAITDWGHRAMHRTVLQAKALVRAFYGKPADHSYYAGCSTGGHQGLMEVQRYPDDFDGVLVGAPGHNRTHLNAGFLWQFVQNHTPDGAAIMPPGKLTLISRRVLESCGAANGGEAGGLAGDPFLNDPFACHFKPAALACAGEDGADCLTAPQVATLEKMYDGARNSATGERIYFGFLPGSEAAGGPPQLPGWSLYWADPANPAMPARANFWKYWAFGDPDWRWQDFDFDRDMKTTDDRLAGTINAMSVDLRAFRDRGGKLIHYHGLADPVVPASDSVSYFMRTQDTMGLTDAFYRLFLVPGMQHCYGGPGPFDLNAQAALEAWVEQGVAPARLVGSNPGTKDIATFSRPICQFPAKAIYRGTGDPESADSFTCSPAPMPEIEEPGADYLR